jgi:hypothetical protein
VSVDAGFAANTALLEEMVRIPDCTRRPFARRCRESGEAASHPRETTTPREGVSPVGWRPLFAAHLCREARACGAAQTVGTHYTTTFSVSMAEVQCIANRIE